MNLMSLRFNLFSGLIPHRLQHAVGSRHPLDGGSPSSRRRLPQKSLFRLYLLFSVLLILLSPLHAGSPDADLDAANRAYSEGRYDDSARLFQQIVAEHGYSAPLCFNLGNAEAKAGHPGPAILNYERARYLAPGDTDIDHNLQLARKQAGLDSNSYRWWQVLLLRVTPLAGYLIVACLLLLILAMAGNASLSARKIQQPVLRGICRGIFFAGVPVCLLLGFVELSAIGFTNRIEGVIVTKDATLRLSPFESAEHVGALPEGDLVTVERRHNDYLWIEARDHHFGWVQEKDLQPVVAGSFGLKPSN